MLRRKAANKNGDIIDAPISAESLEVLGRTLHDRLVERWPIDHYSVYIGGASFNLTDPLDVILKTITRESTAFLSARSGRSPIVVNLDGSIITAQQVKEQFLVDMKIVAISDRSDNTTGSHGLEGHLQRSIIHYGAPYCLFTGVMGGCPPRKGKGYSMFVLTLKKLVDGVNCKFNKGLKRISNSAVVDSSPTMTTSSSEIESSMLLRENSLDSTSAHNIDTISVFLQLHDSKKTEIIEMRLQNLDSRLAPVGKVICRHNLPLPDPGSFLYRAVNSKELVELRRVNHSTENTHRMFRTSSSVANLEDEEVIQKSESHCADGLPTATTALPSSRHCISWTSQFLTALQFATKKHRVQMR